MNLATSMTAAITLALTLSSAWLACSADDDDTAGDDDTTGDDDTAAVLDTVLADEIRHLRHGLGLAPGERVALFMSNETAYLEALYAALWAGLAVVPVPINEISL